MTKIFSLTKSVFGILGTFFLIQIIIGLPLILIFKIDILSKEVTKELIVINVLTELIAILFFLDKYKYFDKLIDNFKKNIRFQLLLNTFFSITIPLLLYLILYKFNNGIFVKSSTNFKTQIGYFISMLILATFEEILCRFILLEKFTTISNKFISITISSLFFAILHLGNPGITIVAFVNLFLFGFLLSLIYFKTKDLLLISFIHFGWNYTIGCIIGSNVSGMKFSSFYIYIGGASSYLDGGKFGIEGSPITLLSLVLIITIYSIFTNKLKDKLTTPNV
jgi:membrane protease YdiL (CAAX protease family)